ncbi:MAG: AAA family ATPase [Candidatus Altiarchaeota archaeon]|nr:AAA family ATPase [Candidatus Altiarchaeota archaeon]
MKKEFQKNKSAEDPTKAVAREVLRSPHMKEFPHTPPVKHFNRPLPMEEVPQDRVPTGIPGLDELLRGGFPKKSAILVTGIPGCAKTTFALQYILNGAVKYGDRGVFITVEQDVEQLHRQFQTFGYDIMKLQREGKLAVFCLEVKPEFGEDFMMKITSKEFRDAISEFGANRLAIDPLNLVLQFSADYGGERRGIQRLISTYKKLGCTTIFTHERAVGGPDPIFGVQDFIVDGIIYLQLVKIRGAIGERETLFERRLSILKMRETDHGQGMYRFEIEKDGIHLYHGVFLRT